MLRKLIKYDLAWINRLLVYYYIITIVLAILTRIASNFTGSVMGDIIYGILRSVTIAAFASVVINAVIRIWVRFRQNHYKDEAYLTHTLPVTRGQLYDSKTLSALITVVVALGVVIGCFFIAFWNDDLYQYFKLLVQSDDTAFVIWGIFITAILEVLYVAVVGFFSIVLGHRSSKNQVTYSVLIGLGLYYALQMILLVAIFVTGFFNDGVKAMFENGQQNSISFDAYRSLIIFADAGYLLLTAGLYFGGKKLFEKGVNVD